MLNDTRTGPGWIAANLPAGRKEKGLSPLGVAVAKVLGRLYSGIFHYKSEVLHERVHWDDDYVIEVVFFGSVSTWPGDRLGPLLKLCDDNDLHIGIQPASPRHLRFVFHHKPKKPEKLAHIEWAQLSNDLKNLKGKEKTNDERSE